MQILFNLEWNYNWINLTGNTFIITNISLFDLINI